MTKGRKKQKAIRAVSDDMPVMNRNAAGIDVGAAESWVSVPADRSPEPIRRFEMFTRDLNQMGEWLKQCGIETVAMESTGVYWVAVSQILEKHGIQVVLVNAKHVKNVSGRKTDCLDCQWLRILHTFGLLAGSFRLADAMGVLRHYLRHRQMLIESAAAHIQHMQKALTQMNLQLEHVLSDITGLTGMRIIRAILEGERNPQRLAKLRDVRTKNDEATIAKALEGHYREEQLFVLRQAVELFDYYQRQLSACDGQISAYMKTLESKADFKTAPLPEPRLVKKNRRNDLGFAGRQEAYRISGVDLTQIDGISESAALTVLSEIGVDMSPWKTEKHFASWMTVCPNNKITGGRIFQRRTRKSSNRVRDVLCLCAQSLFNSRSALGAYARRMRSRLGPQKAIVAVAHKLALSIYRLLRFGKVYVDIGQDAYEQKHKERAVRNLARQAKQYGYSLAPIPVEVP
jgi:transposase